MVQFSNSFYEFLAHSDSRIAQFIIRANRYERWDYEIHRLMITDAEVNYLTLRKDGNISYLPKGKPHLLTDDGQWARDGRQSGKAGKTIKKILTKRAQKLFTDSEYEDFANHYKAACDRDSVDFVMRPNVDIPDVYCMDRASGHGTLADSCMNGDSDFLDIYRCCPHVQILTLINGCGELCGRALVWNVGEGEVLMDRVYVAKDQYYQLFLDHAKDNGWIRKVDYRSYREKDYFTIDGENTFNRVFSIVTPTAFDYYPYIDTFTYGGDGYLTNATRNGYKYEYCQTSGSRDGDDEDDDDDEDYSYCEHSGNRYHDDDLRYIERGTYSGSCIHSDYAVYCETDRHYYYENCDEVVEISDSWYRKDDDDVCYVEDDQEYYLLEDCEYSEFHDEYIHSSNCSYSNHHETYIKDCEAYNVAGEIFHESVVNKVD